jgi:retinol dehydrogenase 12
MSNEGVVPVEAKTCLVTGATSGIGKATAGRLAQLGATVIAVARDRARGEQAATEVRARAPGARVEVLTADLSRLGQVRTLAAQIGDRHDRLDVLVNNAGVAKFRPQLTWGSPWPPTTWDRSCSPTCCSTSSATAPPRA